jgi:hypothetical protein
MIITLFKNKTILIKLLVRYGVYIPDSDNDVNCAQLGIEGGETVEFMVLNYKVIVF